MLIVLCIVNHAFKVSMKRAVSNLVCIVKIKGQSILSSVHLLELMAHPAGNSCWKQWWRISPNSCFSKRILLLLAWYILFSFAQYMLIYLKYSELSYYIVNSSSLITSLSAPFIGWLADVKIGRYDMIKFGAFAPFLASIMYFFSLFTAFSLPLLSTLLYYAVNALVNIGDACFATALLPFLADQLIGATSDELCAVIYWFYWAYELGVGISKIFFNFVVVYNYHAITVGFAGVFAVPLAVIIISDCLCQQWLDRTHKVTNPIKLIIQVLNYTRKHSYPERRSAFTYIDEEQPTRMDFGKEKFGGPFTEEEVEDVKTFLRLIPLLICLDFYVVSSDVLSLTNLLTNNDGTSLLLDSAARLWLLPIILIPLYHFLIRPLIRNCVPSLLKCTGLGIYFVSLIMLVIDILSVVKLNDINYLTALHNYLR